MKQPSGNKRQYTVIGLMSGTSLDGLDMAACRFRVENGRWNYSILKAETIVYIPEWKNKLAMAHLLDGKGLTALDRSYGTWLGNTVRRFCEEHRIMPDLIASHGHTILHMPERGYTLQIGHGGCLAAASGFMTISDFRSGDVAKGGQGAPLVPAGDRHLFPEFDACLNLGGFANISFEVGNTRSAGDICPVNIVLNYMAEKKGYEYDPDGNMGRSGYLNPGLLEALNNLEFYKQPMPRSLGREWVESSVLPLLQKYPDTIENQMSTFYDHIALQISGFLKKGNSVLVTGGGAFNTYLMERLKNLCGSNLIKPDIMLVKYKEALIFAFLGVLRIRNEVNCMKTVTGASQDSSSGALWLP